MSFEEPLTPRPRYVFRPHPTRPGAVFVHTPQHELPPRLLDELAGAILFAIFAAMMGGILGAILGVVVLVAGGGGTGFLWTVIGGAGTLAGLLVGMLVFEMAQGQRRRRWMRRYPAALLEQASARAFAHWLGTLPPGELEAGPLRGEVRWKVHAEGLTLTSMSTNDTDEGTDHDTIARAFACIEDLPPAIRERSWSDLDLDARGVAHWAHRGHVLASFPPGVCMTGALDLSSAHQRLPVLGALMGQGQGRGRTGAHPPACTP
jgi:hypothetical protein